jgi:hypothetical protein
MTILLLSVAVPVLPREQGIEAIIDQRAQERPVVRHRLAVSFYRQARFLGPRSVLFGGILEEGDARPGVIMGFGFEHGSPPCVR